MNHFTESIVEEAALAWLHGGIRTLDPDPSARREAAIETVVTFVRRLRLIQLPGGRSGFGWITGSDEWVGTSALKIEE